MDILPFLDHIEELSDLELAVLTCLVAQEHCIVETEDELVDDVASELALIASDIFGLSFVVIDHATDVSVDDFCELMLDPKAHFGDQTHADVGPEGEFALGRRTRLSTVAIRAGDHAPSNSAELNSRMVVNMVVCKNFNLAEHALQIQALELIRRRRIFSRTTVHVVPKMFVFIPVIAKSTNMVRLYRHLNDCIFISHLHEAIHGFANLEELEPNARSFASSHSSMSTDLATRNMISKYKGPRILPEIIDRLRELSSEVTMTSEIRRYLQDIVVFLRMERGVDGGVTPSATTHFISLAKTLAPLHSLQYVTPSLIALAARKVYRHRLELIGNDDPNRERSMQWGSNRKAIREYLSQLNAEAVIENVLEAVTCPL